MSANTQTDDVQEIESTTTDDGNLRLAKRGNETAWIESNIGVELSEAL